MSTPRPPSEPPNDFSDDAVEIEVVPAAPPKRVPRAVNPAVDNMIHSGEISEPRSLVIRSSHNLPAFDLQDEPTRPSIPEFLPSPVGTRLRYVWLAGAALAAAAAIGFGFVGGSSSRSASTVATPQVSLVAEMIGATADADARAALVRAQAIASSPVLRAGIETDAQTVADMIRDKDFVVSVEGAEVVEVVQIRGGVRTLMLRVPATAPPIQSKEPGVTRLESNGAVVTVVATAEIPRQKSGVSGEVVVSLPVDLEPIKKRISEVARRASLIGLSAPIVLVASDGDVEPDIEVPIKTTLRRAPIALLAAAPPAASIDGLRSMRLACMGLAGLFLILFVITLIRR